MAIEIRFECQTAVEVDQVRWLILDVTDREGCDWRFIFFSFVRWWRKRGLEKEGLCDQEVPMQLNKQVNNGYPLGQGGGVEVAN